MQKYKKDNLENKLFETFDNQEQVVPNFVWNDLENKLFPKKKKRLPLWLFLGCCFILAFVFLISNKKEDNINQKQTFVKQESIEGSTNNQNKPMIKNEQMFKSKILKTNKNVFIGKEEIKTKANLLTQKTSSIMTFFDIKKSNNFENGNNIENVKKVNFLSKSINNDSIVNQLNVESQLNKKDEEITIIKNQNGKIIKDIIKDSFNKMKDSIVLSKTRNIFTEFYVSGGYSFYDISQNESYLRGGKLSPYISKSNGFILGFGTNLKIKRKHNLQFGFLLDEKTMTLPLDIYLDATNYKNVINNNEKVAFNEILSPNCNELFFVSNSKLNYKLFTWSLQALYGYNFYSHNHINISGLFGTNLNILQNVKINTPSFINIDKRNNNYFNRLNFQIGLDIGYTLNKQIRLSFQPYFQKQFFKNGTSDFRLHKELVLPFRFSYLLN